MEVVVLLVAVAALVALLSLTSPAVHHLRRRPGHMWTLIPDQRGDSRSDSPVTTSDRSIWTPKGVILLRVLSGSIVISLSLVIWILGVELVAVLVGVIGITLLGMGVGAWQQNRRLPPR